MANNFQNGPGGRLKKEEKKNTLYVTNPNDKSHSLHDNPHLLHPKL